MPIPSPMPGGLPASVADCLEAGGVVLTANSRALRLLERQYAAWQRSLQRRAWVTPAMTDWESWTRALWEESATTGEAARTLLNPWQEERLWTRIIEDSAEGDLLRHPAAMALLAQQAYQRLCDYTEDRILQRAWGQNVGDATAFWNWAQAFERECQRHGWMSISRLTAELAKQKSLPVRPILLVGFDRLTPAQQRLLEHWQQAGGSYQHLQTSPPATPPAFLSLQDFEQELATCARWTAETLARRPDASIAILVPAVEELRGALEREFLQTLAPEQFPLTSFPGKRPFEFSLGVRLAEVPLVKAALLLLRWPQVPLLEAELLWLMGSGLLALSEGEIAAFEQADLRLRRRGAQRTEWSLAEFLSASAFPSLAPLLDRLRRLQQRCQQLTAIQRPALDWAGLCRELLEAAGWPGYRPSSSAEFQARQKWDQFLDLASTLSFDGGQMSFSTFVQLLRERAEREIFSTQSTGAPVQILEPYEASGQHFDALWFLGASEQSWPPRSQPHPLLPLDLQKHAHMPGADMEADWQLARQVTERLAQSAEEGFFSYSRMSAEGVQRPSPLVLSQTDTLEAREPEALSLAEESASLLEPLPTEPPIPYPAGQPAGGADTLRRQSLCAFQSFAGVRLHARRKELASFGLTASQRGNLLHAAMHRYWKATRTQAALLQHIAEASLSARVAQAAAEAFAEVLPAQPATGWRALYLQAEQDRLARLLTAWLEYESKRQPFEVEETEWKRMDASIGNLSFHFTLDRVDSVQGGKLLLDYKTGVVSTSLWSTPRPEEPQLPLYALAAGVAPVSGVLFAQIRTGDMRFKGHVEHPLQQISASLGGRDGLVKHPLTPEKMEEWRKELERLAAEFLAGVADVAPKDVGKTCRLCDLASLCRVAETDALLTAPEENGNGAGDEDDAN